MKKGDYIVVLPDGDNNMNFIKNYCYKQKINAGYISPELDLNGSTVNGLTGINDSSEGTKWRHATPQEIEEYNKTERPFDTSELTQQNNYEIY